MLSIIGLAADLDSSPGAFAATDYVVSAKGLTVMECHALTG
jgi:hypothetical protein